MFVDAMLDYDVYRHTGRLSIHGEAGDKAALYRDRYQVLLQRLARDKYFSRPAFETVMTESDSCEVFSLNLCCLSTPNNSIPTLWDFSPLQFFS
jgi:hypothetical protein